MVVNGGRVRLRSWKEIAAFFGADARTVKRWEATRGLPVHRPPGDGRASVFAYRDELEAWLERTGEPADEAAVEAAAPAPPPPPAPPVPAPAPAPAAATPAPAAATPSPRRRLAVAAAAAAIVLAVGGAVAGRLATPVPSPSTQGEAEGGRDPLFLAGVYQLQTRTAAGLSNAIRDLSGAIVRDPANAAAFARLAEAWAMSVQYTDLPARDGYDRTAEAARRALALDPACGRAMALMGLVAFYRDHDLAAAKGWFARAVRAAPGTADVHHWYALTLMHGGDQGVPLAEIARAQALDPGSRAILANRALILFHAGRAGEAEALLRDLSAAEPALRSPPEYLATIYMAEGRWPDFLRESTAAARAADDAPRLAMLRAAAEGWRTRGDAGLLAALYAGQQAAHDAGRLPAFKLAQTAMLMGDRAAALRWLDAAARGGEPDLVGLLLEPALRPLHADPRFRALARGAGLIGGVRAVQAASL